MGNDSAFHLVPRPVQLENKPEEPGSQPLKCCIGGHTGERQRGPALMLAMKRDLGLSEHRPGQARAELAISLDKNR